MLSRNASILAAAAFALSGALAAPAMAASVTFFQFQGESGGGSSPEFVYNATTGLSAGPGAVSDGTPLIAPGLMGIITGGLPGVPFILQSDLTLVLTGFAPVDPAAVGANSITQNLGAGTFAITHSSFSKPLLAGTVSSAFITETKVSLTGTAGDNASVLSGLVTYSDSVLEDLFVAYGLSNTGSFSFAMTGLTGTYGTTLVAGQQRLASFTGDGTGSFDANLLGPAVPAPASVWGGFGLVAFLGAARMKKRREMSR